MLLFKNGKTMDAMFQQTGAQEEFHNKLAKIYQEGQNTKYIQYTIMGQFLIATKGKIDY